MRSVQPLVSKPRDHVLNSRHQHQQTTRLGRCQARVSTLAPAHASSIVHIYTATSKTTHPLLQHEGQHHMVVCTALTHVISHTLFIVTVMTFPWPGRTADLPPAAPHSPLRCSPQRCPRHSAGSRCCEDAQTRLQVSCHAAAVGAFAACCSGDPPASCGQSGFAAQTSTGSSSGRHGAMTAPARKE
jgi:hypothetical protein